MPGLNESNYQKVIKLYEQGVLYKDIERIVGVGRKTIWRYVDRSGIPKRSERREQNFIDRLAVKYPNFEYAGNYQGEGGTVDIRCKRCGHVMTRTHAFIRKKAGTTPCEKCKHR